MILLPPCFFREFPYNNVKYITLRLFLFNCSPVVKALVHGGAYACGAKCVSVDFRQHFSVIRESRILLTLKESWVFFLSDCLTKPGQAGIDY